MKILTLELKNFRQYYGQQKITFSTDNHQNTTIIFGENGKGKTGIYRAIMFALFGSKHIPQDNENKELHLVNFIHIDDNKPDFAEGQVTVEFEHEGQYHILTRTIVANKTGTGKISERTGRSELKYKDEQGNITPTVHNDEQKIKQIVNKILDEEIKDFFLFDAEKIDTLTKNDEVIRRQVKDAIFNLLQMNNIEEAKNVIQVEKRRVEDRMRDNVGNEELNAKVHEKEKLETQVEEKKELLTEIEKNIIEAEKTIDEHTLTLNKNRDILVIQDKVANNIREIGRLEGIMKDLNNDFVNDHFHTAPYLIMQNTLLGNAKEFDNFLGEDKVNIPAELIEESLEAKSCLVCNTDLEVNVENKNYVSSLLESYKHSETFDLARTLIRMYENKKEEFERDEQKLNSSLQKYRDIKETINNLIEDNEGFKKEISNQAKLDINLSQIEKMISLAEIEKKQQEEKHIIQGNNIEELKVRIEEIIKRINYIYSMQSKNEKERTKFDFLINLENSIKKITKDFNDEMRMLLGKETTSIFKELIDQKDIDLIEKVEINGKFEIKAIDQNNISILSDISQGQRQILSLAFITALARLAVKRNDSDMIDYPLFMDSPFNRLSGNNRDHLISQLPTLTSQWILLLTDTELTYSEEKVFKNTGHLGKWYKIEQIEAGHSEIVEVDLSEDMATRGG